MNTDNLVLGGSERGIAVRLAVLPHLELLLVEKLILLVHLPHLLYFVKIDYKAAFVRMVFLNALSAENGEVVRAVKVLDPLVVLFANQAIQAFLVLEVDVPEDGVSLN